MTSTSAPHDRGRAVVVGASLAGLVSATALSRQGWSVTVLERAASARPGMGLAVDVGLLAQVTGIDPASIPVIKAGYAFTGWALLHEALRAHASATPGIELQYGTTVTGVRDGTAGDELAFVQTLTTHHGGTTGAEVNADLVIGADGYNSRVRAVVAPVDPTAPYSGFLLWRGLLEERAVAAGFERHLALEIEETTDGVLATFAIPGADGDTSRGGRRGVFTWFDESFNAELAAAGRIDSHAGSGTGNRAGSGVEGGAVHGTWHGPQVPDDVVAELVSRARRWACPWRDEIARAIDERRFIGTPVAEYVPTALARGRVALVGDAGHVVSPVTGAGFHNAALDVQALVGCLADHSGGSRGGADAPVVAALAKYDRQRLPLARALVQRSRSWSSAFTASR